MSKNKLYNKGIRFEREVVAIFKAAGWDAIRSAGSHSPYDVILIKKTELNKKILFVAFVQCKVRAIQ
jgi:Holliday junction resolvase